MLGSGSERENALRGFVHGVLFSGTCQIVENS